MLFMKFALSLAAILIRPQVRSGSPQWEVRVAPDEQSSTTQSGPTSSAATPIEAGGPWLGVQFGPVSAPLASHLQLKDGAGQMILNVVEGSPADQAGFLQYDVITEFDGQQVPSHIEKFMDVVRGFQPGQAHSVTLFRQGQRQTATLVVGTRPDQVGKYKYEMEPQEITRREVIGRGGMLEKDGQGNWVFKQFDFDDLPNVWKWIPGTGEQNAGIQLHDDGTGTRQIVVNRSSNGKSTRIERDDDGRFTVTTTERINGKESSVTQSYDNEDAIKTGDPQAYELFMQQGGNALLIPGDMKPFQWIWKDSGECFPDAFSPEFNIKLDERIGKLMKELEARGDGLGRSLDERMQKRLDEIDALRAKPDGVQGGSADAGSRVQPNDGDANADDAAGKISFDVSAEGRIRVTTRRGSEELVQNFADEAALKTARPDWYERYRRLQDGE